VIEVEPRLARRRLALADLGLRGLELGFEALGAPRVTHDVRVVSSPIANG
jgi:hypothetical protein